MKAKRIISILIGICILVTALPVFSEEDAAAKRSEGYTDLLIDMITAYRSPGEEAIEKLDSDVTALNEDMADVIASQWKEVWLNPDYQLLFFGRDDPAVLPVKGKHAFVVLGFQLKDGEMTDELIGRCDAAAAAAEAFPDSILVCTGGATGNNNPDGHTEAGLMKDYFTEQYGIAPERVVTDERAMDTVQNAWNTMELLKENGIESMTIITSDYHQRRAQTLYNAVAGHYLQENGYRAEMIGNFCYEIRPEKALNGSDLIITLSQMTGILQLNEEDLGRLKELIGMGTKKH